MRKKILITLLIIITLFQAIVPIKISAFVEEKDIISAPAQINNYKEQAVEENEMTGLDLVSGIIMEPTVEFFTFILDSLMSVFTGIMVQEEIQPVMVSKEEKDNLPDLGNVGGSLTIDNAEPYKKVLSGLESLEYPRFPYSPEEIFAGNIDLLDVNFIDNSNTDESWLKIRDVIKQWYQIFRMIAIIGLLSVLIYTGIKIVISSNTKDKAKYKEMIVNWFIAVILAFSMHYIMAFILAIVDEFSSLLNGLTGVIEVTGVEGINFKTNLMGLARFQMQQQHFSAKVGHLVIYTALVVFTFKFTFVYFKRVLRMAFLTIISPIVALTYPIDKMNDGTAQGFDMWLKEFIFNALLQPMHYLLYYILVSSSLTLAAHNPVYGIVALGFMTQAEKLLKKIFGFGKARAGTVGGIAGAFATGAVVSSLMNYVRDPLHPFGLGKGGGKSTSSSRSRLENESYSDEDGIEFLDDTTNVDGFLELLEKEHQGTSRLAHMPIIPDIDKFFTRYRQGLSIPDSEIYLDADNSIRIEDILKMLAEYKRTGVNPGTIPELKDLSYEDLKNVLRTRVEANESDFTDNNIQPLYIDGEKRTQSELLDDIMMLNEKEAVMPMQQGKTRKSEKLLRTLKHRMAENEYIQRNGGALLLKQQEEARINELKKTSQQQEDITTGNFQEQLPPKEPNSWEKFKQKPVTKGVARVGEKVGKTIIKPVWDVEKGLDWKYNGKRLAGNILKGTAGLTVGVAAAAVQAGISITDGKYNPLEGAAAVGAGIAGVSHLARKAENKLEANSRDKQSLQKYSEQWFNRDDVINNYNMEYPGQGKAMRRRAVNNYVSRGITDLKEQKQAMKYAEVLKKERGLDEEEADKIAVATLQYKKGLAKNNSYMILFDEDKREKYINLQADVYTGAASKASVRQLHEELIQNVRDFDRANR